MRLDVLAIGLVATWVLLQCFGYYLILQSLSQEQEFYIPEIVMETRNIASEPIYYLLENTKELSEELDQINEISAFSFESNDPIVSNFYLVNQF